MADNVVLPGTGETIAADDIGGVLYQRVKLIHGADGIAHETANANPLPVEVTQGELLEQLSALRYALQALTRSIGQALPNASGQPIMEARQATAANLAVTASIAGSQTLATVTTVSTLTNQTQIGGLNVNEYVPALYHLQADNLRRNIAVT
ncbi:MAG: hypothetical protein INH34_14295 [Phycisphaerales bacterium]|nr:hypothetical protein [Phycisphaerales bacterium]